MIKVLVALLFTAGLIAYAVFWNEGRKEVFYLCGNFAEGTSYASVDRQLKTANRLTIEKSVLGTQISLRFYSKIRPSLHQCRLRFDRNDKVLSRTYE
ncbi:hypothetical protein [Alteromonas oceanisediminis]|uniref:hypothetical protein n=1 Tax=Alteromonas oceanisediminis TaxID=2836180 RepID=UPI001BDB52BB|nr:hypothetical protein [Alteromonas oceanisediminis]MBT0587632.1 hypothetical protein [Alteromonas oceanisediminis]